MTERNIIKNTSPVNRSSLFFIASDCHYRSTAGVCNLVFTVAMFVLVYRFFRTASDFYRGLMLVAIGSRIGVAIRIIGAISMIHPSTSRIRFSSNLFK